MRGEKNIGLVSQAAAGKPGPSRTLNYIKLYV